MNILFLSCLYSSDKCAVYQNASKSGYQNAAQNFQEAIVDGFLQNNVSFTVATIPSLSTCLRDCNITYVEDCDYSYRGVKKGRSFGYINLPIINHFHQSRIDKFIDRWYNNTPDDKCILVYALLRSQMQYAVAAKKRHPDIKLCIIIPDLPLFMNCNKYYKMLGLQKSDMLAINTLIHQFDGYVVLTEPMVEYLDIAKKPYIVIEGIYSESSRQGAHKTFPNKKTIMYAGGIQTRYGVFDLIEAFHRINNEDYRLILCGGCQEMEKLQKYLESDNRIKYLGIISTEEARSLQKKVTLLVNPRHSTEDFTKYSFPSKTLEYMASGTPVLMSSLPSMPKEYKEHLFLFDNESIDGIKNKILDICSLSTEHLCKVSDSARIYILEQKCAATQTAKIIKFIETL